MKTWRSWLAGVMVAVGLGAFGCGGGGDDGAEDTKTPDTVADKTRLLDEFLRREGRRRPRIAVLAFNPHAYEFSRKPEVEPEAIYAKLLADVARARSASAGA